MDYLELTLSVEPDFSEILMAELAEIGFDSFIETEDGLQGYVLEGEFDERSLKNLMEIYAEKTPLIYSLKKIEKQNWNKEWESNFSPIEVLDQIYIRANFHPSAKGKFTHEIVITPKMSFGTGHHETTSQMMELQLEINHQNRSVLDVGTGTGILAILAAKLGADRVHAFDIDEWSVENTIENIALNDSSKISIEQGTIATQKQETFDIVLANINRNILLEEIPAYAKFSNEYLLVSGFYQNDIEDIQAEAESCGFEKIKQISKNNWAAVVFKKH
jgi:ribosomal protein L11 methyltransferase